MTPVLCLYPVKVWARMACRIIELCHNDLEVKGGTEFECEFEPSQCNGPHLGVGPVISEKVPSVVPVEIEGMGA
ncbi:hypothetical protein GOBAR_AA36961 [Gossypium barbadense]|uniref:Uncharacterized protein n=1 Tax=Gossypium barbadense TaxID=3634 RepID=A0A2P5VY31_GOSBA|nr:hypothetical protein GOBAR_AA36961 [Gossypium barbadense]